MKKIMNKINFAIITMMVSVPAFAGKGDMIVSTEMCGLIKSLQHVFSILRIAAFIGAAFMIAGWAWTYISKAGDDKAGVSVEDVKKKGIGLLVGFGLLFMIGAVLSFVMSASGAKLMGCPELTANW